MKNDPSYPNRQSKRLQGYDYSQDGLYFITICVNDRECLLGRIEDGKMVLNGSGKIAQDYLLIIPEKYPKTQLHEFMVMPNHIHAIIEIKNVMAIHESPETNNDLPVGAIHESPLQTNNDDAKWVIHKSPEINYQTTAKTNIDTNEKVFHELSETDHRMSSGAIHESPLQTNNDDAKRAIREWPLQRDQRRKMLLSKIIGWYKMNTGKYINIANGTMGKSFWQRNYYDHIIRNETSFQTIADYIKCNPAKWKEDRFFYE
jgi:putative transposase